MRSHRGRWERDKMAKKREVKSRIIITYAQEETIANGKDGIEVIPFWKLA